MHNSIPELLLSKVFIFKNKKIIFSGSEYLTYQELVSYSYSLSRYLKRLKLKKGDRVCLCMNKSIYQIISIVGCLFSNLVFVPILPKLSREGINHIISNSQCRLIITDKIRIQEIDKKFNKKCLIFDKDFFNFNIIDQKRYYEYKKKFLININASDNAAIIYSSGSTGLPKGIIIPHINLVKGAHIVSSYLNTKYNDRILGILSFNFDYGLNQLWQCFLRGCSIFLYDYIFSKDLLKFIKKKNITVLPLMPVIMALAFHSKTRIVLKKIRYICTSGGPVEKNLIVNLKKIFPKAKIYLMYGLTEAFRSTFLNPRYALSKYNSIGQAIPMVKIHILNKKYEDCKAGEIGELVHRGGCVSKGYFRDKNKTNKIFRKISRFPNEIVVFSGDLVKKDDEGDIFFVGRKDSLIKTAGYRVSPTEIELQCQKIKKIKFVIACGVYDSVKGQKIICAYTTFTKKKIIEEKLKFQARAIFPSFMMPEKFIFFKNFPVTGNQGKISRTEIIKKIKRKYDKNF